MKSPLLLLWLFVLTCVVLSESANVRETNPPQHWRSTNRGLRSVDTVEEDHVVFRLSNRDVLDSPEVVDSRKMVAFTHLRPGKPTKVVIHGWLGDDASTFIQTMRDALLQHDVNLITVDWSGHGSRSKLYPTARGHVGAVALLVAQFLDLLAGSAGVKLGSVHILGHSLGGQIAGVAGLLVKKGNIGRITGLDPAGPNFSIEDKSGRLSADSADFVDVIHTAANTLGFGAPIGHVDFYPNRGHAVQPGCGVDPTGGCSHGRSYQYFLESLAHPEGFLAVSCQDWQYFMMKQCDEEDVVLMGINTPKSARGVYYLQTNMASPFRRGRSGISYSV